MPMPYFADNDAVVLRQVGYRTYLVHYAMFLVEVDASDGEVRFVSDYEPTSVERAETRRAARDAVQQYLVKEKALATTP